MAEYENNSGDGADTDSDETLLAEARERIVACIEREQEERLKMLDDLRFSTLDQWPEEIRSARENDTANGPRPCLTVDKINQYIAQVVNDERQNRPSIKVRPVDDKGDVEAAKVLQGKTRHIEDLSSAQVAYLTAGESAVRIGVGYFRVVTDYESPESFDQEIFIRPCSDSFSVYLGPNIMPDGSDAEFGFVVDDMPRETFKRDFPKAKHEAVDFSPLDGADLHWRTEDTIRVAEYFYTEYTKDEVLFLQDGTSVLASKFDGAADSVTDRRSTLLKSIKWCKLTGVEVLEKRDWAGIYIPIIKVIGREAIVEGKKKTWGLVRPAKDALRMYNYWVSSITEKMALSPKTPYIGAVGQFKSQGDRWDKANVVNYSRLEYDPVDVNGQPMPAPQRQGAMPIETAMLGMLPLIEHDVQTSLGMFKASVGQEDSQQSGRAILALQRESDTGTFHFPDNLATSIRYCGRIVVDLIPKIYDQRRMLRLLGEDGEVGQAMLDPEQKVARRDIQLIGGKIKKIYNLGVGKYDVTVSVGPSYNTKRMEAAQVFSDLAKGASDPVSAAVMRYLTVKNSDFTSSDEALSMLKALIPPNVLPKQEGEPDIPAPVKAKIMQDQQMLQAAGQKIQELESGAQADIAKAQAKIGADQQAKMAQLAADDKVEKEKQRLAREKFEFEKALEIDKANHAIDLEERRAGAANKIATDKLTFDQECRMKDDAHKAETDVMPKIEKTVQTALQQMVDGIQTLITLQQETLVAIREPKQVTIGNVTKDAAGQVTGATVVPQVTH